MYYMIHMLQVVDIPGLFYKRANNVDSYLKNISNSPLSLIYKPISYSFKKPHSNTNFNTTKNNHSNISNYPSFKNNSLIKRIHDIERNDQWNFVSMYNTSKDSAISMNDNCSDLQNSIIKSENLFHSFAEQTDSGADVTRSSSSSSAIFISNKYSIPTTLTTMNNKNVKFCISESSLFDNEVPLCETISNFPDKPDKLDNYKLLPSDEKNYEYNSCVSPISSNTLSLKYRKNIHYVQNNTLKSKIIPKRYTKWRKTNSCTFVQKIAMLENCKFMKTRSYPNILKCSEKHSDTSLCNALNKRNKHLSKSHTSIFSKISYFSFCPTFSDNKQDTSNSCYCSPEKTFFKKKYTTLSKFFPMPTKISNSKHSLRNTSVFDGKSNVSSTSHDIKTCTDLKTLKDKSLLAVLISLFFFFRLENITGFGDFLCEVK